MFCHISLGILAVLSVPLDLLHTYATDIDFCIHEATQIESFGQLYEIERTPNPGQPPA